MPVTSLSTVRTTIAEASLTLTLGGIWAVIETEQTSAQVSLRTHTLFPFMPSSNRDSRLELFEKALLLEVHR